MRSLLACLVILCAPSTGFSQDFVIRGAKVHTADVRGSLDHTDVLIQAGKITALGSALVVPGGTPQIDARGLELTPGLFGGVSALGTLEILPEDQLSTAPATRGAGGSTLQQVWRPDFDITTAFNPLTTLIPIVRVEGITWTMLSPSLPGSLMAGQGAAMSLDGTFDAVLAGSKSLFMRWGGGAESLSGGSRAAQFMLFDQAMWEAKANRPPQSGLLLMPAGREVFARYLAGGRFIFTVNQASDIHALVEYAARNHIHVVIVGGAEAWVVAKELAAARIPVILNPLDNLPSGFDGRLARLDNAALLHRAGVRIAFSMGDPHLARKARQLAGNAVAHGLPWNAALEAITAAPADILGIGPARGRIAVGSVADLVLWSGDPLEVTTLAEGVWIGGRAVDMHSRQTQLRDRYFNTGSDQTPDGPGASKGPNARVDAGNR